MRSEHLKSTFQNEFYVSEVFWSSQLKPQQFSARADSHRNNDMSNDVDSNHNDMSNDVDSNHNDMSNDVDSDY